VYTSIRCDGLKFLASTGDESGPGSRHLRPELPATPPLQHEADCAGLLLARPGVKTIIASLLIVIADIPQVASGNDETMTISVTTYVEHPTLGLAPTIRSLDGVNIGVIPDAGTDPEHDAHFFWVEASDFAAVEDAFETDETVTDYATVAETPERRTYQISYSEDAKLISPAITDLNGLMLSSESHAEGWIVELRLQDHSSLYQLGQRAEEMALTFDIREIHQIESTDVRSEFALTEPQIEALMTAYEHGYYDEPREISLEELGSILGISRTAVSGRLKRASSRLIEARLDYDDSDP